VWPLRLPGLSSNTGSRGIQTTMPDQCNKDIPRDTALNVNIVLHGITAKPDIHCTNSGCEWKGTYEDHMEHSNKCEKLPMKCRIRMRGNNNQRRNCNPLRSGQRSSFGQGEKQEISCQDCGKGVARDLMGNYDSLCWHKRISCLLTCGIKLSRYVFAYLI